MTEISLYTFLSFSPLIHKNTVILHSCDQQSASGLKQNLSLEILENIVL